MVLSNRDRVGKAFDLLSEGLRDTVDEVMTRSFGSADWNERWADREARNFGRTARQFSKQDVQIQLRALTEFGRDFKDVLSRAQRSFASELRETRNQWAHGETFSSDDTARALDTIERLLQAIDSMDSAADVHKLREDLQRSVYEERNRREARRTNTATLKPGAGMKPWREVIQPHDDVARGEFTASEFAADLHMVRTGQALGSEYSDPVEFFNRTYITEGLWDLLSRALRRLNGEANASPVVNLQTNFGGGKTHSMLALYHLFNGKASQDFPQEVQELIKEAGSPKLDSLGVRRVALVGTYLQAGSGIQKEDGTAVHTLWGELAWQLGGREAYEIVADADRTGTNPGEALYTLLKKYSPALILIDEWVAYARQLVTDRELPAGSFETQFTFAQSLTEVVRSVPGVMLVVSIPASDSGAAGRSTDIEVGGANGQLALERLQNVIRRVADQWRPSSRDESFEIVRRRLFQTPDAEGLTMIGAVAKNFVAMYRNNASSFPRDAVTATNDYEKRIRTSYPLHPELLDRLYEDWSTLERFQRTRGVLKLVSSIVHELWASNDTSPLILPGNVPLSATSVNTDLTQYLEDQWKPIIDADIDSPDSTARRIDNEKSSLGARFITQRIARTIFMGAAPRNKSAHKGLDKQYLWLGTALPGDALGNFGTAIELVSQRSTYFYEDQGHYWFDTQPSVAKAASDYAEQLREDEHTVWKEIVRRLKGQERARGVFSRVHIAPDSTADIPDNDETRLVIVHPRYSKHKQDGPQSAVYEWVRKALESKGSSQRIHRNTLIFLAADSGELSGLEATIRSYLGWKMVYNTADELNLSAQQRRQTDEWVKKLDQTANDRLRSTYVWCIYPEQLDSTQPFELSTDKVPDSGGKSLAERVGTKLVREDLLITELAPTTLGMALKEDLGSRWQNSTDMSVGELWEYFTRYVYMSRLANRQVLDEAVLSALDAMLLDDEKFALAVGKDDSSGRYRGLVIPPSSSVTSFSVTNSTLVVNWDVAMQQVAIERTVSDEAVTEGRRAAGTATTVVDPFPVVVPLTDGDRGSAVEDALIRYFGSVKINSDRYSRDIGNVTREIIDRLVGTGAELEITIDIQATKPEGFNETEVRTINENAQVLKFDDSSGFEKG
ncbi:DUF499 domain-containing protein [Corynebacterium durum]|uniref:DUF499 domain-containing protein n=1 Tax=Corynebacterium durum TaxID=61592 RepID=UPI00288B4262|nr:DUF499 domain-containing protein [Corynebacterium durum]